MVSVTDLHNVVSEYLTGSIDRKAFSRHLFAMMYGIEKTEDAVVIELGYEIEFSLAEAIAGLIAEEELRSRLARCVNSTTSVSVAEDFRAKPEITFHDSTALPYRLAEVSRVA
jgi:hypothetical protein